MIFELNRAESSESLAELFHRTLSNVLIFAITSMAKKEQIANPSYSITVTLSIPSFCDIAESAKEHS